MLPESDLEAYERHARENVEPGSKASIGQQAAARKILKLAAEVKRCWALLERTAEGASERTQPKKGTPWQTGLGH